MVELLLTVLLRRLEFYKIKNTNVLCFHNTSNNIFKDKIYNGLNLEHKAFDTLITKVKNKGLIISYDKFEEAQSSKETTFLFTFDDGYYSNYNFSKFFLEKTGEKIHIFPTINFVNNKIYPWWILLWNLIQKNDNIYVFNNLYNAISINQKRKLYKYLHGIFLKENTNNILLFIHNNKCLIDENYTFLSEEDILYLNNNKLASFGLHTLNHQNISYLTQNEINLDVLQSVNYFNNIGINVNSFAIPFGLYNRSNRIELINIMKSHGINNLFSTHPLEQYSLNQINIFGRLSI
jgi:peptidoglycan/xylan/chitin deacetylase (PgdA/CDA1 family)